MPYVVVQKNGKWVVMNPETKKVFGSHPTRRNALKQLRALYANVPDARKK